MPGYAINTPQSQSSSLWNIFSRKTAPPPAQPHRVPCLDEVISVSPSAESFNLPEMANGKRIHQAVMAQQDRGLLAQAEENADVSEPTENNSKGSDCRWKIAACLIGVVGITGSVALVMNPIIHPSTTALRPINVNLRPIIDNSLTFAPDNATTPAYGVDYAENNAPMLNDARFAALHRSEHSLNYINNELRYFKNIVNSIAPRQVLVSANYLNTLIRQNIYTGHITPEQAKALGQRLEDINQQKFIPLIKYLKRSIKVLKETQFNNDTNILRIESAILEKKNIQDAQRVFSGLVIDLNRKYLNYSG